MARNLINNTTNEQTIKSFILSRVSDSDGRFSYFFFYSHKAPSRFVCVVGIGMSK